MARFLSPEWVGEQQAALEGVDLPDAGPDAGLAVSEGSVTVVQEVRGTPDGDVSLIMIIEAGTIRLDLATGAGGAGPDATGRSPDVTIVLAYEDAAALSQGTLSPAEALNAGRIRVRGDLSALVTSQRLLNETRAGLGDRVPPTTY